MALISVVVPIYNVEEYLEECINSIINQSYKELEIILVNDGSTDNSGRICENFKKKDDRIICIHQENAGLSEARNAGIDIFKGDYICFVDSDDWIDSIMIELLFNACTQSKASIGCCGRIYEIQDKSYSKFDLENPKIYSRDEAIKQILVGDTMDVACWDKIYTRDLFQDLRFPKGKIHEDMAIIFNIFLKSNKCVHVGKALYHYRQRPFSITKISFTKKNLVILENINYINQLLNTYTPLKSSLQAFTFRMTKNLCTIYLNSKHNAEYILVYKSQIHFLKKNILRICLNRDLRFLDKLSIISIITPFYPYLKKKFSNLVGK